MNCISCGYQDTSVKNSRALDNGTNIRRRRECRQCGYRFTTYEKSGELEVLIVKKNGATQKFDIQKLKSSLRRCLIKDDVESTKFDKIVNEIQEQIQETNKTEITSEELGDIVMEKLKQHSKAAFIRFASVYKNFISEKDFLQFIEKL